MSNEEPALETYRQARRLFTEQKYSDVINLLEQWLSDHPQDAQAQQVLCAAYSRIKDWEKAHKAAQAVTRARPHDPNAWCSFGIVCRRLGRYGEAARCQYRALSCDSDFTRAQEELARLQAEGSTPATAPAEYPEAKPAIVAPKSPGHKPPAAAPPPLVASQVLAARPTPTVKSLPRTRLRNTLLVAAVTVILAAIPALLIYNDIQKTSAPAAGAHPPRTAQSAPQTPPSRPSAAAPMAQRRPQAARPSGGRSAAAPLAAQNMPPTPSGPPLTAQDLPERPASSSSSGSGLPFIERPGSQERPKIIIGNASYQRIGMIFNGPVYRQISVAPYSVENFDLPVGEYRVALWGETIDPRYGWAVFQRYKEYETTWVIVSRPAWQGREPLRMGDIE